MAFKEESAGAAESVIREDSEPLEEATIDRLQDGKKRILDELHRRIVGQEDVIELALIALFAGGHC